MGYISVRFVWKLRRGFEIEGKITKSSSTNADDSSSKHCRKLLFVKDRIEHSIIDLQQYHEYHDSPYLKNVYSRLNMTFSFTILILLFSSAMIEAEVLPYSRQQSEFINGTLTDQQLASFYRRHLEHGFAKDKDYAFYRVKKSMAQMVPHSNYLVMVMPRISGMVIIRVRRSMVRMVLRSNYLVMAIRRTSGMPIIWVKKSMVRMVPHSN